VFPFPGNNPDLIQGGCKYAMKNALKFREKIARHHVCLGAGITFYDPTVTDALCPLFDFVWIDMEHNALSLESVQGHIIATQGSETAAIVRVPSHDPALIKTVLDLGADGIIVPNVRTLEEAQRTVAACRYPPEGIRGYGPRRPSGYGRTGGPAFCQAANRAVIAITQIEHIDAIRDIDRILAIPGLDSIVFGPNDLSGSMGHMGQPKHPAVVEAIESAVAGALRTKVAIGFGGGDLDDLSYWIKKGAHWLVADDDVAFMIAKAEEMVAKLRHVPAPPA
jgi:2-keto-3-deoxy-L-rhamnonate aldolase RhmA